MKPHVFSLQPNPDGHLVQMVSAVLYKTKEKPGSAIPAIFFRLKREQLPKVAEYLNTSMEFNVERSLIEKPEFRHLSVFGVPEIKRVQKWVHMTDFYRSETLSRRQRSLMAVLRGSGKYPHFDQLN